MNSKNENENEIIETKDEDYIVLDAEYDDVDPAPAPYVEKPNEPTLFGWFFWWMLICFIPVIGLISAGIVSRKTKNISKKRFLHAGMVWNVLIVMIGFLTFKGVKSTIKGYDNILHGYLGDYGSTIDLAGQAMSGDWNGALERIDFEKMLVETGFTFKDIPESVPIRDLLAILDFETILNKTDFSKINWNNVTDTQLQALYDALPQNRIRH